MVEFLQLLDQSIVGLEGELLVLNEGSRGLALLQMESVFKWIPFKQTKSRMIYKLFVVADIVQVGSLHFREHVKYVAHLLVLLLFNRRGLMME